MAETLASKIWKSHVVTEVEEGVDLLYIDMHLLNEVSCPQAFTGLDEKGRKVRRPRQSLGTIDHNNPTSLRTEEADPLSIVQAGTMVDNCRKQDIACYPAGHALQGIVHVIGPEQGLTLPGTTIVCGDSHTSTHGAFGTIAFGIGTSEVEHVLATQCLISRRPRQIRVTMDGTLPPGVTAKDAILGLIQQNGVAAGAGSVVEYAGSTIRAMSMEARMTVCNMSIEWGARMGLIAPDDTTLEYVKGRPYAPKGAAWDEAVAAWRQLRTDDGATFDEEIFVDATRLEPYVTWGTNPAQSVPVTGRVPEPANPEAERALRYMDLTPGTAMQDIEIDRVFIGSCTNSRLEDLIAAARIVEGRRVSPGVRALVVPGSMAVKAAAERIGLDKIFEAAGFEWRLSGCSMCMGLNPDSLGTNERCASTSNRNFENRQGPGGRTHLVSPIMAAAAALHGHFVDVRTLA
ncbi:MAG: 3-isopropylmalate dehydratase large subunit [Betaproteobacteria bacterium]